MIPFIKLLLFRMRLYHGASKTDFGFHYQKTRSALFGLSSVYVSPSESFLAYADKIGLRYRISGRDRVKIHLFDETDVYKYNEIDIFPKPSFTIANEAFIAWAKENQIYYCEALVWMKNKKPTIYFFCNADEVLVRMKFNVVPSRFSKPPYQSFVIN